MLTGATLSGFAWVQKYNVGPPFECMRGMEHVYQPAYAPARSISLRFIFSFGLIEPSKRYGDGSLQRN